MLCFRVIVSQNNLTLFSVPMENHKNIKIPETEMCSFYMLNDNLLYIWYFLNVVTFYVNILTFFVSVENLNKVKQYW